MFSVYPIFTNEWIQPRNTIPRILRPKYVKRGSKQPNIKQIKKRDTLTKPHENLVLNFSPMSPFVILKKKRDSSTTDYNFWP